MFSEFRMGPRTGPVRPPADAECVIYKLTISHSPRPLAAGPIRNAENLEYLLAMVPRLIVFTIKNFSLY